MPLSQRISRSWGLAGKRPQKPGVVRSGFVALLADVKGRIQSAQTRAVLAVSSELVRLYWDIGRIIDGRQQREGWGSGVIPRLALELKNELPDLKGFSERNIDRMIAFYRTYPAPAGCSPPPVAKLLRSEEVPRPVAKSPVPIAEDPPARGPDALLWSVPWAHHVILMEKVKDLPTSRWYMEQTLANGWSRNALAARGASLGLSEDELAFYDALETNDSAVKVLGDETLRAIARELVETVRSNVTIDWTFRENVRAQLRILVKRILRKHGYPPDKQEKATQTVLEQAEVLSAEWIAA